MNEGSPKTSPETLSPPQRLGEVIYAICMVLLFAFLLYHQIANTGFFTEKFGAVGMFCLYGPIIVGITPLLIRAWIGQRNVARPFEAATSLFLAVGSLWLVIVFPLNYAHLADALPGALRFILAWVTDDIGKAVLILQVIIGPISAFLTISKYMSIRQGESDSVFQRRAS